MAWFTHLARLAALSRWDAGVIVSVLNFAVDLHRLGAWRRRANLALSTMVIITVTASDTGRADHLCLP